MKHNWLVEKSAKWLKKHSQNIAVPNCSVIASELVTATSTGEIPDVIGFCSGRSVLIEVKVSRSDFLRDKSKLFRYSPYLGVGQLRLYCCPENLITINELPEDWGLLYSCEKGKIKIVKKPTHQEANFHCERSIMYSMLRRLNK